MLHKLVTLHTQFSVKTNCLRCSVKSLEFLSTKILCHKPTQGARNISTRISEMCQRYNRVSANISGFAIGIEETGSKQEHRGEGTKFSVNIIAMINV